MVGGGGDREALPVAAEEHSAVGLGEGVEDGVEVGRRGVGGDGGLFRAGSGTLAAVASTLGAEDVQRGQNGRAVQETCDVAGRPEQTSTRQILRPPGEEDENGLGDVVSRGGIGADSAGGTTNTGEMSADKLPEGLCVPVGGEAGEQNFIGRLTGDGWRVFGRGRARCCSAGEVHSGGSWPCSETMRTTFFPF